MCIRDSSYSVDWDAMQQVNTATGKRRAIRRRGAATADALKAGRIVWECESDSGWSEYGADIAGRLESALGARAAVSWDAHGFTYSVDWGTVQQVNGKTGRRRAIRRSVAGAPTELGAAAPQAVPVTVAAAQSFYVQVPPNGAPGATMRVTAPNGVVIDIVIPPGAGPGASFEVATPAAPSSTAAAPAAAGGLPQCAMDPSPTFRWEYEDQYVITGGKEASKTLRDSGNWKALDTTLGFKLEAARIRGSPQVPDSSGSVAMVYDVAAMTQTHRRTASCSLLAGVSKAGAHVPASRAA